MPEVSASGSPAPDPAVSAALEDVLIALQKSFSRVSARSSEVAPENARALIVGDVNFELELKLAPSAEVLRFKPDGALQLRLNGVIRQDIRAVHQESSSPGTSADAPKPAPGSTPAPGATEPK